MFWEGVVDFFCGGFLPGGCGGFFLHHVGGFFLHHLFWGEGVVDLCLHHVGGEFLHHHHGCVDFSFTNFRGVGGFTGFGVGFGMVEDFVLNIWSYYTAAKSPLKIHSPTKADPSPLVLPATFFVNARREPIQLQVVMGHRRRESYCPDPNGLRALISRTLEA